MTSHGLDIDQLTFQDVKMKKAMFVGRTGCGKTTLMQAIQGKEIVYRKTQAVGFCDTIIDTPGEFVENRHLYSALLASSIGCDVVGLVQDATSAQSIFPPKFGALFNLSVIGIVSKIDLDDANSARAEKFLKWAGAARIFRTSSVKSLGIRTIVNFLNENGF